MGVIIGLDINSNSTGIAILSNVGILLDFEVIHTKDIGIKDYVSISTQICDATCRSAGRHGSCVEKIIIEDAKIGFRGPSYSITVLTQIAMIIACVRGILSDRLGHEFVTCVAENTARAVALNRGQDEFQRLEGVHSSKKKKLGSIKNRCIAYLEHHCGAHKPSLLSMFEKQTKSAKGDVADAFIVGSWYVLKDAD